jgi:hypothetical protein
MPCLGRLSSKKCNGVSLIELQARHVDGLTGYSDLAKRASDILAQETERLRLALIQLEDMERATRGR